MDCWYDFVGTRNAVVETTVVPSACHLEHPLYPSMKCAPRVVQKEKKKQGLEGKKRKRGM